MSFQEDKDTMTAYLKKQICNLEDDEQLEAFFQFIETLEEKATEELQYNALLTDAYMEIGNVKKAKDVFSKIYNPKNKKDVKKLVNMEHVQIRAIIQPSKRAKMLPQFRYVDKQMLKNQFIYSDENACSVCRKKSVPLYVGMAYISMFDAIYFQNHEEQFCADCLCNGAAAKEMGLTFNTPMLKECTMVAAEHIEDLLYRTPECSSFFDFNEDIWPICCGDFCRYIGLNREYEEQFYFQCIYCGKKIKWTKMT